MFNTMDFGLIGERLHMPVILLVGLGSFLASFSAAYFVSQAASQENNSD